LPHVPGGNFYIFCGIVYHGNPPYFKNILRIIVISVKLEYY
jgi:hypothetical protein